MDKVSGTALLFALMLMYFPSASQTVRINEFMSSNAASRADEDGDNSDWIEFYNVGNDPVQLNGWGVSDNRDNPFKWTFPDMTLEPGKFLLVWASGKNRRPVKEDWAAGLVREVFSDIPGTSVISLTQHASYPGNPSLSQKIKERFEAPQDVSSNYGQRMHGFIKAPLTGNYYFWISSDDNGQLWLSTDEQPSRAVMIAEVTGWTNSREWSKYPGQNSAPVFLEEGRMYYISALMKEGTGGDNLAVGWQLPDGTLDMPVSGKYLFSRGGELHTNFSISAEGEELLLTRPGGTREDELAPAAPGRDISLGRKPDGGPDLKYFNQPTPGGSNTTQGFNEVLPPPVFSKPGGFYPEAFNLTLSSSQPGVTIVYTLDGSVPDIANLPGTSYPYLNQYRQNPNSGAGPLLYRTMKSQTWSGALLIQDRSSSANQISRISTTYDATPWYFPSLPIDKAMVVRARTFKDGALPGEVVSHSYFIRSQGGNSYRLPVVSLMAPENALFDFYKGIYVAGTDFENWRSTNPNATANGGSTANYHREGDQWEYPAHIELFDSTGTGVLNQEVGFRIHGNWSNASPFKSLRIYARKEYGLSVLPYLFFKTRSDSAYKRIILRNSGNDIWYTMFRDAALQEMVRHMNLETQAYRPSVLFINGEYWGIHNIRERFDKFYFARRYGVNEEQLDILENNMTVDEGSNAHFAAMIDHISVHGVSDDNGYAYVNTLMDVSSFMDYQIAQIFMVNTDWPGNNIKYWRLQTSDYLPGAGRGRDGRWRWMLYDADYTFGIYTTDDYSKDMMVFATRTNGPSWPNPDWSTFLFRKLLENESFRTAFIVRFCDELNTAFLPEVVTGLINRMQAAIEPEMARHIQRWKMPSSLSNWYANVAQMRSFADRRPYYMRNHLRQFFTLSTDYLLTADVSDPRQGYVKVNTLPLTGETRGVAANPYPWKGVYFRKVPLRLEAIPLPGYEFAGWTGQNFSSADPVLELTPDANLTIRALFRKSEQEISSAPVITQPANGSQVEKMIIVTWTGIAGALRYELQISGHADFSQPFLMESNLSGTSFPVILPAGETGYFARVRAFTPSGAGKWSDTISFRSAVSGKENLLTLPAGIKVYPNPFSGETFVEMNLEKPGPVEMEILSLTGRKLAGVVNGYFPAGFHTFRINGSDLPSGPCLLRGKTGSGIFRCKLVKR